MISLNNFNSGVSFYEKGYSTIVFYGLERNVTTVRKKLL